MEWEELRSLHLGSSGGPEAEAFPSSPPEHQRKSQLKISARLGVWRKWQVKEALSCPFIPHPHPLSSNQRSEQQLWGYSRAINYSEKRKKLLILTRYQKKKDFTKMVELELRFKG